MIIIACTAVSPFRPSYICRNTSASVDKNTLAIFPDVFKIIGPDVPITRAPFSKRKRRKMFGDRKVNQ